MFLAGLSLRSVLFALIRCPGEESNLHAHYGHMNLNHARLPIPPPGLVGEDLTEEIVRLLILNESAAANATDPGQH